MHFFIRDSTLVALHTGNQPTCTASCGKTTYRNFLIRESNLHALLHSANQPTWTSSFGKPTYMHFLIRESNLLARLHSGKQTTCTSYGKPTTCTSSFGKPTYSYLHSFIWEINLLAFLLRGSKLSTILHLGSILLAILHSGINLPEISSSLHTVLESNVIHFDVINSAPPPTQSVWWTWQYATNDCFLFATVPSYFMRLFPLMWTKL
jgi:hypothetical protein